MSNQIVNGSEPNPELVGLAFATILRWADENGIPDVSEEEVRKIVEQYEGVVEPEPFVPVVEAEPLFVERRKQVVVS